jgi:hypothetical protein
MECIYEEGTNMVVVIGIALMALGIALIMNGTK